MVHAFHEHGNLERDDQYLLSHIAVDDEEKEVISIDEEEDDGELHENSEEEVTVSGDESNAHKNADTNGDSTNLDKLKSLVEKAATFSMIIGSSIGQISHIEDILEKHNSEESENSKNSTKVEDTVEKEDDSEEEEEEDTKTYGKKRKSNRGRKPNAKKQKNTNAQEQIIKMSSSTTNQGVLVEQPKLLSGSQLRPYQLVGCNWLIRLYEKFAFVLFYFFL